MTKSKKSEFRPNEYVVYPAHGVGQIVSIEEQEIAGISMELFVISFEKDKMTCASQLRRQPKSVCAPLARQMSLIRP